MGSIARETDDSIFLMIPEYNLREGMIPKSRIHAKRKMYDQIIKKLKKRGTFPCVIQNPVQSSSDLIDLLIYNDQDTMQYILDRYESIQSMVKLLMFCCKEADHYYRSDVFLSSDLFNTLCPLNIDTIIDPKITNSITNLYNNILKNPSCIINLLNLSDSSKQIITERLCQVITETGTSYGLDFQVKIIGNNNQINALKNLFGHILSHPSAPVIRYIAAPNYHIVVNQNIFEELEKNIREYINNIPDTYDFVFDLSRIIMNRGICRIQYPYIINLSN